MRADPKSTKSADDVLRIWLHECDRVFADRLVSDEDRQWLKEAQAGLTSTVFGRTYDEVVTTERLVFGDFMIPSTVSHLMMIAHVADALPHKCSQCRLDAEAAYARGRVALSSKFNPHGLLRGVVAALCAECNSPHVAA